MQASCAEKVRRSCEETCNWEGFWGGWPCEVFLMSTLQVLSNSEFRLQSVVEAAMEIAGLQAAQKRLQVRHWAQPLPKHLPALWPRCRAVVCSGFA